MYWILKIHEDKTIPKEVEEATESTKRSGNPFTLCLSNTSANEFEMLFKYGFRDSPEPKKINYVYKDCRRETRTVLSTLWRPRKTELEDSCCLERALLVYGAAVNCYGTLELVLGRVEWKHTKKTKKEASENDGMISLRHSYFMQDCRR